MHMSNFIIYIVNAAKQKLNEENYFCSYRMKIFIKYT